MNYFSRPSWKEIISNYETECPICHSKSKLIDGANGLFFGCIMYFKNGCKGKTSPSMEILKELEEIANDFEKIDEHNDAVCGLMECYPDWDPDEEDVDSYREANGLD